MVELVLNFFLFYLGHHVGDLFQTCVPTQPSSSFCNLSLSSADETYISSCLLGTLNPSSNFFSQTLSPPWMDTPFSHLFRKKIWVTADSSITTHTWFIQRPRHLYLQNIPRLCLTATTIVCCLDRSPRPTVYILLLPRFYLPQDRQCFVLFFSKIQIK
jgi:hypothetical protein